MPGQHSCSGEWMGCLARCLNCSCGAVSAVSAASDSSKQQRSGSGGGCRCEGQRWSWFTHHQVYMSSTAAVASGSRAVQMVVAAAARIAQLQ
jgi:hypothetical protein